MVFMVYLHSLWQIQKCHLEDVCQTSSIVIWILNDFCMVRTSGVYLWSFVCISVSFGLWCVSQCQSKSCMFSSIHSFIHLFIPKIYIAPFHGFYSEMLLVLLSIQHSHYLPVVSPSSKSCMEWIFFNQLHSFLISISSLNMLF